MLATPTDDSSVGSGWVVEPGVTPFGVPVWTAKRSDAVQTLYLWPDHPFPSLLVLAAVTMVFLYLARVPMHRALEALSDGLAGGLSKVADWTRRVAEQLGDKNRRVILETGRTHAAERLNQELKRRTHVVRIFPNAESCLRLIRALAVETHENWLEATRYLNMAHLAEHKKDMLRRTEQAEAA